mmetsp:Transcript_108920/g.274088  ORF Transcript_108920/g.274088 Transcript_108920/m.274088 type:complete len:159 (-) Transcript_108920:88-564(-)
MQQQQQQQQHQQQRQQQQQQGRQSATAAASRGSDTSSRAAVETQALRPPDEVTSGWDVFDPDDQIEHTIPTAPAGGGGEVDIGGWDMDVSELLVGGTVDAPSSSAATGGSGHIGGGGGAAAPELSPASLADEGSPNVAASAWGADMDLEGLLGGEDLI